MCTYLKECKINTYINLLNSKEGKKMNDKEKDFKKLSGRFNLSFKRGYLRIISCGCKTNKLSSLVKRENSMPKIIEDRDFRQIDNNDK